MADVTISQLTQGTPAGNNIVPYSTGSNTLGAPVSAIFQNTSKVYFNSTNDNVRRFSDNSITGTTSASFIIADNANKTYPSTGALLNTQNPSLLELRGTSFNFSEPKINFTEKGSVLGSIIVKNYAGNTGTFHFCTNNTNFAANSAVPRMTISSSGVVTKPFQPAFAIRTGNNVILNNPSATPNGVKMTGFNTVSLNEGNCFDVEAQKFTAPVTGIYSFSGVIRLNKSTNISLPTQYFHPVFVLNGGSDNLGYVIGLPGLTSNWSGGVNTANDFLATNWHFIIKLNANDFLEFFIRTNDQPSILLSAGQSCIFGYLLG